MVQITTDPNLEEIPKSIVKSLLNWRTADDRGLELEVTHRIAHGGAKTLTVGNLVSVDRDRLTLRTGGTSPWIEDIPWADIDRVHIP